MKTQKIRIEIQGKGARVRAQGITSGLHFYRYNTTGWQVSGFFGSEREALALACIIAQQFDNSEDASLSGAMVGWAADTMQNWIGTVRRAQVKLSAEQEAFHANMTARIDETLSQI